MDLRIVQIILLRNLYEKNESSRTVVFQLLKKAGTGQLNLKYEEIPSSHSEIFVHFGKHQLRKSFVKYKKSQQKIAEGQATNYYLPHPKKHPNKKVQYLLEVVFLHSGNV